MKEVIIGRHSDSAIKVPEDKTAVSGSHVKIIIDDNGRWIIEDLDSTNGTFLKDENGDFQRIFKKEIGENSIIRLGQEGYNSFQFMAHRAISEDDSYEYEFRRLKKLLKFHKEEEITIEKRNYRNMLIIKFCAPIAMVICILAQYIIPGLRDKADLNLWLSRGAMALAPVVLGIFFKVDTHALKALKQRRTKMMICPKCGMPISEFEITNMQCARCKAK